MTEKRLDSPFAHESPELRAALDEGDRDELPDNVAPGLLTERPVDLHKVDSYEYRNNAGMVQENSGAVRWMVIVLLYAFVITGPVALWLLWRDRSWTTRQKAFWTVLMVVGYAFLAWKLVG